MTIIRGREQKKPFSAKVDVAVVGSGAGGAVIARELAAFGLSVIVLEEGGHYTPEEYGSFPPSHTFRRLAREAGLTAALGLGDTPLISLLAGKCVGGSSVLTGGVCFRIPDEVLHEWSTALAIPGVTPEALDPIFREVEKRVAVETVPTEMRSRATEKFVQGAAELGIPMKPLRRNTHGCKGAARCNFGCPNRAKMSVDISFLPDAIAHGAVILSDALVERVDTAGGVARGVRGRFLDETGEPSVRFEVRAKLVVVACGSMHTPLLLKASGLTSPHVGKHLTLHPCVRVGGVFDDEVNGWDGALQSAYSDHFMHEGIVLNGVYAPVNVLAAAFPGVGRAHKKLVHQMPNLGFFGGMVHDEGGGVVRRGFGREPVVTYRMIPRDKARLLKCITILGKMAFAAGAKEVLAPIFGLPPVKSVEQLEAIEERPPKAHKIECLAFHPLGSAKMSRDEKDGVVKPTCETWAVKNLIVGDGSILPTSIGVNSQLPIMGMAMRTAQGLMNDWKKYAAASV
jgi:choline dehydrogenase-like flavoprotein